MTTIFIKNLKLLASGQLKLRWSALNSQLTKYDIGPFKLTGFIHDTILSSEQGGIIDTLGTEIVTFDGTGDDLGDKNKIKALIAAARKKVETARVSHAAAAISDTLACLDELSNAVENFYTQLEAFPFPLLNCPYKDTPEHIVYSHACNYLGLSKFQIDSHSSIEIRKLKEEALITRLVALKKAIRPEYNLEQQRETTVQALNDLARDNSDIVKPKKAVSVPIVSAGFTLFAMPLKGQTATAGTMEKAILLAKKEISELTVESCACPKAKPVLARALVEHAEEDVVPKKPKVVVAKVPVKVVDEEEDAHEEDEELEHDGSRASSPH